MRNLGGLLVTALIGLVILSFVVGVISIGISVVVPLVLVGGGLYIIYLLVTNPKGLWSTIQSLFRRKRPTNEQKGETIYYEYDAAGNRKTSHVEVTIIPPEENSNRRLK
ncbi:MAG: hypothetical protein ACRC5C_06560 [Bacilli bacterium]